MRELLRAWFGLVLEWVVSTQPGQALFQGLLRARAPLDLKRAKATGAQGAEQALREWDLARSEESSRQCEQLATLVSQGWGDPDFDAVLWGMVGAGADRPTADPNSDCCCTAPEDTDPARVLH